MKTKDKVVAVFNAVAAPAKGIIAGGSLTDMYFGKEVSDVDVFIPQDGEMALLGHFLKNQVVFKQKKVSFKVENSPIVRVYELEVDGIDVDAVVLRTNDVVSYVLSSFDGNFKKAWYDGSFHASHSFWMGVMNNEYSIDVDANVARSVHYIRAVKACEKYGLELKVNAAALTAYKKLEWMFHQDVYAVADKYADKYAEMRAEFFKNKESLNPPLQTRLNQDEYGGSTSSTIGEYDEMTEQLQKELQAGY